MKNMGNLESTVKWNALTQRSLNPTALGDHFKEFIKDTNT